MLKKLIREVSNHKFVYFLLLIILGFGLFLRVYNLNNILGFYYDQGRDALSVWNLWHLGNIPFIGPVTGIAGIFRGPFYYYLIAPFYLIGNGNPIYPSVFLSATTVIASGFMYYLGFKIQDRLTGLIAAILSSFSLNIVLASRWLSNPTPMLLLSMVFTWMLLLITEGKHWAWAPAVFIATVSLFHFGSAGELFYFAALLIIFIWQLKLRRLPGKKVVIWSIILVFISILPLIAFDIKNHGLIVGNIKKFLFTEGSFKLPAWWIVGDKFDFYYDVFTNKIFNARYYFERFILGPVLLIFFYNLHRLIKKNGVKVLVLLLSSVILGLVFFQGNFGNIYDYYLTGYYLPFLLLFAIALGSVWKSNLGKILVIYFVYIFLSNNAHVLQFKLMDKGDGPNSISFWAQKEAIGWIYKDAKEKDFNVDVYVPPVIPYAYDYLFKWFPTTPRLRGARGNLVENNVPLLYLLYEHDPDHQERIDAWMARQKGIAKSEEIKKFGAITVERRLRIQ